MTKGFEYFSKEDTPVINKHTKKFSASLVIRKIQIKTIMRYHFTSTVMTNQKDQ